MRNKQQSPNEPLDLEIELMSSVSAESPLRVGVNVETMAPLDEKSLTHSNQHRNALLSDCNRTIGEFRSACLWVCALQCFVKIGKVMGDMVIKEKSFSFGQC